MKKIIIFIFQTLPLPLLLSKMGSIWQEQLVRQALDGVFPFSQASGSKMVNYFDDKPDDMKEVIAKAESVERVSTI